MNGVADFGRRGALALGLAAVLGACTSPSNSWEDSTVRTDSEPLERRFAALGPLSDAHWLGTVLGAEGRGSVPGPTDVRVVGFARMRTGGVRALAGAPQWRFRSATPSAPPEPLLPYLPESARWVRSPSFDDEVTGRRYAGTFYLDESEDRVYFDTTNPLPVSSSGP
ncbi:hypothetical protein ACGF1Z_12045 [Streptomyces sp. NPDC048018]|uniref:hypothetical protein n=1 Tax=Streptomyces sp. NPDC048018 TaxID=3365499 RepID=UPI0037184843